MARIFRSGAHNFGSFDMAEEIALLCACPTYKHVFEIHGQPSLSVYRRKRADGYRGHAKLRHWHIHTTIAPTTSKGGAYELLAHELAHLICHKKGLDGLSGDHREKYHHRNFDEVLRTLILERHGFDIPVGDRRGRYDYSQRVHHFLADTLPDGKVNLFGLEESSEPKRTYQRKQASELWGWKIEDGWASVKLQTNQRTAVEHIFYAHEAFCKRHEYPVTEWNDGVLKIPLHTNVIVNLVDELNNNPAIEDLIYNVSKRLGERVSQMYQHCCLQGWRIAK